MMLLYEFDTDMQLRIIQSHLQKYGRAIDRKQGSFGDIFVFKANFYPYRIVAKCPTIKKFGDPKLAREALEKALLELENTFKSYKYHGVHPLFEIMLIHGWPFLLSRGLYGILTDLINGPPSCTLAEKLMNLVQVAHTLNYCRSLGLIAHQDLKPDNIFFDLAVEKYVIEHADYVGLIHEMFVADFGMADALRDIGVNRGSRPYMAPEQYERGLIDRSRIDMFALAVIAFEYLTDGTHPIGERTRDVWPDRLPEKPGKWRHEDVWKKWANKREKLINLEHRAGNASA